MTVSIQRKAFFRLVALFGALLAGGRLVDRSLPLGLSLLALAAVLFLSALFWPRCPHCGVRVVRFNQREWIPGLACWRCGRAYDEARDPPHTIQLMDALAQASKLRKSDPPAAERLMAAADAEFEAAETRYIAELRTRMRTDPDAAAALRTRLRGELRDLPKLRRAAARHAQSDADKIRSAQTIDARERSLHEELRAVEVNLTRLKGPSSANMRPPN